jgi:hypothetical protein
MGVEHREVIDSDGRRWRERVRDGVMESRELLAMRFQPEKVQLEIAMEERWSDWFRWKTTREEAMVRGAAAPVVSALTVRENASWAAYAAAINEWRQA